MFDPSLFWVCFVPIAVVSTVVFWLIDVGLGLALIFGHVCAVFVLVGSLSILAPPAAAMYLALGLLAGPLPSFFSKLRGDCGSRAVARRAGSKAVPARVPESAG